MKRIVSISGTSRPDNYTSLALAVVNDELRKNDIEVIVIDARAISLPFPGHPDTEDAVQLRSKIKSADGVVLATPEYHGSFCAMVKLIIENLGFPSAFSNKPVALLGVAGGRIGAIKSIEQLRGVCAHTGAIVIPNAISIAGVRSAFDEEGNCTDPASEKALRGLAQSLLRFLKDYVYPKQTLEAMVREEGKPWATSA